MYVAKKMFLTKGVGRHREKLVSFEMALRDAGLAPYNLVRVSSIYPPHCRMVTPAEGLKELLPGQIVHAVLSECSTNEFGRDIAAAIGVAIPQDADKFGYLSEHHSYGEDETMAGDYAEDLAAEMLATTLGVDYRTEATWDEKKEIWEISGQKVRTMNITQTAIGTRRKMWTTVVAGGIFLF